MNANTEASVARILSRVSPYVTAGQLAALSEIVEYELKRQDRDTRHACAEAVNAIYDGSEVMTKVEIINRAHAACINTQAV